MNDQRTTAVGLAGLTRGSQVLGLFPSTVSPLSRLPSDAFADLLVLSATRPPNTVERTIREAGGNSSSVTVVPISSDAVRYDGPLRTTPRVDPADLTGISMQVSAVLESVAGSDAWIVVDNLTVLLMYADPHRFLRFTHWLVGRARASDRRGVYALVRGTVSDDRYDQLRRLFDGEVGGDV